MIYRNEWGETADTEEELYTLSIKHMNPEDLIQYLEYQIGAIDKILSWMIQQENFNAEFHNEIASAKKEWFYDNSWCEEEEEEDPATYEFEPGRVYWNEMAANP